VAEPEYWVLFVPTLFWKVNVNVALAPPALIVRWGVRALQRTRAKRAATGILGIDRGRAQIDLLQVAIIVLRPGDGQSRKQLTRGGLVLERDRDQLLEQLASLVVGLLRKHSRRCHALSLCIFCEKLQFLACPCEAFSSFRNRQCEEKNENFQKSSKLRGEKSEE